MHQYIVHASLQLIPLTQDGKHPYQWVDEVIAVIAKSGLPYQVDAFSTIIHGTYFQIQQTINAVNEYLYEKNCAEWILQTQIQIRSNGDMLADEKTAPYQPAK